MTTWLVTLLTVLALAQSPVVRFPADQLITVYVVTPAPKDASVATEAERRQNSVHGYLFEELRRKRKVIRMANKAEGSDVIVELGEVSPRDDGTYDATLTLKCGAVVEKLTAAGADAEVLGLRLGNDFEEWVYARQGH